MQKNIILSALLLLSASFIQPSVETPKKLNVDLLADSPLLPFSSTQSPHSNRRHSNSPYGEVEINETNLEARIALALVLQYRLSPSVIDALKEIEESNYAVTYTKNPNGMDSFSNGTTTVYLPVSRMGSPIVFRD